MLGAVERQEQIDCRDGDVFETIAMAFMGLHGSAWMGIAGLDSVAVLGLQT